jgi:hypothetical protein
MKLRILLHSIKKKKYNDPTCYNLFIHNEKLPIILKGIKKQKLTSQKNRPLCQPFGPLLVPTPDNKWVKWI